MKIKDFFIIIFITFLIIVVGYCVDLSVIAHLDLLEQLEMARDNQLELLEVIDELEQSIEADCEEAQARKDTTIGIFLFMLTAAFFVLGARA